MYSIYSLTDEDKAAILGLARDPRIGASCVRPHVNMHTRQWY